MQAAYEVLSDAARRAAYDLRLAQSPSTDWTARSVFEDVADDSVDGDLPDDWAETMADAFGASGPHGSGATNDDVYELLFRLRRDAGVRTCAATTKSGRQCFGYPYRGGDYCFQHTPEHLRYFQPHRKCTSCFLNALIGSAHCWRHSTAAEREGARKTAERGKCISLNDRGQPCGALSKTANRLCYRHGVMMERVYASSLTWSTAGDKATTASPTTARDKATTTSPRTAATKPKAPLQAAPGTTRDTIFGCGCGLLVMLALAALVYFVARWSEVEKGLSDIANTALTVGVMLVLLNFIRRRKR